MSVVELSVGCCGAIGEGGVRVSGEIKHKFKTKTVLKDKQINVTHNHSIKITILVK